MNKKNIECFALICCITVLLLFLFFQNKPSDSSEKIVQHQKNELQTALPTETPDTNTFQLDRDTTFYSFSQGPKAWKSKKKWSGSWCNLVLNGNKFGSFGCGFCCMANIYCTLSDYSCSPVDIYKCAKRVSSYNPSPGFGAIDWNALEETLTYCGFETSLHTKPLDYSAFQTDLKANAATIILVSSQYDDSFWKNTPGHYVTIWNYDSKKDTVFLSDSGDPTRNRKTIPLKTAYKALKLTSSSQYLSVSSYNEENNNWKWNQISEEWVTP
ncbi:MAG: hypothetical protein IIY81_10925 [Lachnospiraceae bacterium]|jgi:hypothetical protein|nr:hypothetical protein [Lachnospiraceae bacterium]